MAGPRDLSAAVRPPAVAGLFYPADAEQCRNMARGMLHVNRGEGSKRKSWLGGIVPHAGWICSGAIAGETIATLSQQHSEIEVIVVFGAIHTPLHADRAALDTHARWRVPLGEAPVAGEMSSRLAESDSALFAFDERFHRREHAVEVELPLIQLAWPHASVLPIEVPAIDAAADVGRRVAAQMNRAGLRALYLASSDLTHYGPNYDFAPVGVGIKAMQWAKDNDRRLLQVVTDMRVERVVTEARAHHNACGAGAIAAMMAACRELGASAGVLLRHASSFETLSAVAAQEPDNSVGYASVLVG